MASRVTANLPSADFDRTEEFYGKLGFTRGYRDEGWMILANGPYEIEFFPMNIDPASSWFSACLRTDDLDGLYETFSAAGLPQDDKAIPRIGEPVAEPHGIRLFYMLDPDGSLIRVIDEAYEG
ncbi:bleomycin resistance protein [Parvularcula marina]|uniref:bleomycin resistance protein n=1 Tax=Parvularcula marina TaxID=2292771 RepID=UPI0035123397